MSIQQSTPGPWIAEFGEVYRVRSQQDGGQVAMMMNLKGQFGMAGRRNGDEVSANARLIAAAPDLLDACRKALYALKGREHDQFLRDAIAKATGEQP